MFSKLTNKIKGLFDLITYGKQSIDLLGPINATRARIQKDRELLDATLLQTFKDTSKRKQKYCMSHLGWTTLSSVGLCSRCGSAMLQDEDMR